MPLADTDIGKGILKRIIPLVAHLRQEIPLMLQAVFNNDHLEACDLPSELDCRDLLKSDRYFAAFHKKFVSSSRILSLTQHNKF